MRGPTILAIGALLLTFPACGSDSDATAGAAQASSQSGTLLGVFVPDPDPPVVGENQVTLTLTGADSVPVEGATVSVEPWMPAHGHGSVHAPTVTELGGGHYQIDLTFRMPGRWELRTQVDHSAHDEQLVVGFDVH